MPFRYQRQYEDQELDKLYYNQFRYYDSNTGTYINQAPIWLAGNNPNFYAYTHDSNTMVDPWGLMAVTKTVDFTGHVDLFPTTGNQKNIVTTKLQEDRSADFTQAFKEAGINKADVTGYTWHYLYDFNSTIGETTMQLIKTDTHKATIPHKGSVYQFEAEFGVKYGTPEAINKAKDKGWVKCK